jgi:hypothetical protein
MATTTKTTARKAASAANIEKDPVIVALAKAVGGMHKPTGDYVRLHDGDGKTVCWALKRRKYVRVIGLKKKLPGCKIEGAGKTRGILVTEDNVDKVAAGLKKVAA